MDARSGRGIAFARWLVLRAGPKTSGAFVFSCFVVSSFVCFASCGAVRRTPEEHTNDETTKQETENGTVSDRLLGIHGVLCAGADDDLSRAGDHQIAFLGSGVVEV